MRNLNNQIQAPSAIRRWAKAALITAPLMAFALMIAAPAANADGYRGGGYDRNYDRGYERSYNRRHQRRHQRRHHPRYSSRYSSRLRGFDRRGYRYNRYSRNDRRGAYLIGGLVVGSLITHAITNNRNHYRNERRTTRVYDRNNSYSTYNSGRDESRTSDAPVSRRLFRDAQGNCFERQTGPDNQELLIDLPAEECRW